MKTPQKGSVAVILLIIIVLLVIGFGAYLYLNKKTTQQNGTPTSTSSLGEASFTIHTNPLIISSTTPTLTGTYNGDYAVGIAIVKGNQTLPQTGDFSNLPNIFLVDYSDHGGNVIPSSPTSKSGTFTYTVSKPLPVGTYTVGVYVYHNIYTTDGYQGDSVPILTASTTLIVK